MGGGGTTATVAWSGMTLSPDRQMVELRLEVRLDGETGSSFPDEWRQFLNRQGVDDFRTGHDWAVELTAGLLDAVTTGGRYASRSTTCPTTSTWPGPARTSSGARTSPGFRTKFTGRGDRRLQLLRRRHRRQRRHRGQDRAPAGHRRGAAR